MLITLYAVRHGKPLIPEGSTRYIGRTDLALSAEGAAQAETLSRAFQDKGIAAVYSSPLARCTAFARIMRDNLRLPPVVVVDELAELNLGAWENRPIREIQAQYPQEYADRGKDLGGYRTPGGESFSQCQTRAVQALSRIARRGRDALIISHAGLIRAVLCHAERRSLQELFSYQVPYGGVFPFICADPSLNFP